VDNANKEYKWPLWDKRLLGVGESSYDNKAEAAKGERDGNIVRREEFWILRVDRDRKRIYAARIYPWHVTGHYAIPQNEQFRLIAGYSGEPRSALVEIPISQAHDSR
jgi:hypothetical protein